MILEERILSEGSLAPLYYVKLSIVKSSCFSDAAHAIVDFLVVERRNYWRIAVMGS